MIVLPSAIGSEELLGRGIFDSRKAKHAQRGKIPPSVFRERSGVRELSVDRLSFGGHDQISALHDAERSGQRFHGWATLKAADACRAGRIVEARPIETINPYHAEIVLPEFIGPDIDEEQEQHALNLAMAATWLARPTPRTYTEDPAKNS
jgi:hypothetical protein